MTRHLICIIGTDGSGKTTLSDAVVEVLQTRGESAERVWLGAESFLMKPVRGLLRLAWGKRRGKKPASAPKQGDGSQRTDYAAEIARKNALARKYGWATRFYIALVWADYRLQLALKRWRHRAADTIVADRYLFDVAINIGLTVGWSPDEVVSFVRTRLGRLALPEMRVFLRVSPEVSLQRKDDIFDIDYLHLRFSYYEAIARAFGFVELDGTLPIADNRDWLLGELAAERARPYVLYVHANNTDIGGADKVLALMAEHMRDHGRPENGNRVAVCVRLQTAIVDRYAEVGIPVIHHPFERPQVSRGIGGLIRLALASPLTLVFFWRLFGRERPDIVHINDLYDFLPALAARLRGVPVVWHIRMIITHDRMRAAFARVVAKLAPVSVSVSRAVRDHYFPTPVAGHEALVIHDLGNAMLIANDHNPSVTASRPEGLPEHGLLVLMVGRIEPWKGQDVFIEAVRRLPASLREGNVFALAGGGVEAKENYLAEIRSSAAKEEIIMLGSRDDVPVLMCAADVSVHASTKPDPFPGVVIESLLAGAATIAAGAGGAVEMIDDGVHGRLTPPGDAAALSAALEDFLTADARPRARFGATARARALGLVNARVVDAAIEKVYDRLAQPKLAKALPARSEKDDE
ncbi:MAG: glycosyltransferase [Flavobacteriaceae bacterium]|uniref:glycosyltransferase n=1 Tax=Marivivens aquimaris TaxID=2774876 RepID=UPI001850F428|nr:glycosyltransferase [Marivivens aquimaris]NVJ64182.1 glycosyltransferase [Flavobacteriaceae bacterium]